MSVIRWEEPPPRQYGEGKTKSRYAISHELLAVQLKRKPGEWALVYDGPVLTSLGSHMNSGKYVQYRPAGSFEAVYRYVEGQHRVYARYIGETS